MYNSQQSRPTRRAYGPGKSSTGTTGAKRSFGSSRPASSSGANDYKKRRMTADKLEVGSDNLYSAKSAPSHSTERKTSDYSNSGRDGARKSYGSYSSDSPRKSYGQDSRGSDRRDDGHVNASRSTSPGFKQSYGERTETGFKKRYNSESDYQRPVDSGAERSSGYSRDSKPRFGSRSMQQNSRGGGRGGNGGGGRKIGGTSINISQLINKVNDEAFIKPTEHVLEHEFKDFLIDKRLLDNVSKKGYISPTPIQDKSIPPALEGKDVIGIANTGTGKTAAFLIPLINKVLADRTQKIIIVTPTRELAVQIADELKEFVPGLNINSVLCIGGSNIMAQSKYIRAPFNFLVGTPGRIIDLCKRRMLFLDRFSSVVLDEADRMVDMGFINDIKFILGQLPKVRHSLFFTATLEASVEGLIREFMDNPVKISVKVRDTAANVEQDIVHVPADKIAKQQVLTELLCKPGFDRVLVFGRTKFGVEKISRALRASGIKADSIHGDKSQNFRLRALQSFKRGDLQVLVATDVAARGLDISNVSHVINYDLPANYEDYVHRIGRTGRADKKGVALTFVTGQAKR